MKGRITRRGFVVSLSALGAAAGLGFGISARCEATESQGFAPHVYVRLDPDGTVTITNHRAEMGQGVRGTLPWIIAGEMGASYERVAIEQAEGHPRYGNQNTDGSSSVRNGLDALREAGAVARAMLIAAAAERWGVEPAGLEAQDHVVTNPASGETLGFGELAADAALQKVPKDPPLRERMAHLDKPMPHPDWPLVVTGQAVFGADVRLPGMLTAVVARPPAVHGLVRSFDPEPALAVPGVKAVIELPPMEGTPGFQPLGGVAVVAEHTWAAIQGRRALEIEWEPGPKGALDSESWFETMRERVTQPGKKRRNKGRAEKALEQAAETFTATYEIPFLSHAQMEPVVAVADVQGERAEIWAPVQAPQRTRKQAAGVLGLKPEQVTVHQTLLGGAFGRKGKPDFTNEAAFLSQQVGAPVRVQWTREDDMRHGYYHAASVQRIEVGWDEEGALSAWLHRVASPPIIGTVGTERIERLTWFEMSQGLLDLALDIPNVRMEAHKAPSALRIGWMRSVYNINHGFAVQSFVDELARREGVSTPEMLKRVLGPARLLKRKEIGGPNLNYGASFSEQPFDVGRLLGVIDQVVQDSGYQQEAQDGRAFGFAAHGSFTSYVAAVVSLVRDSDGAPKLDEAWLVVDAGQVMNQDRAVAQMEGAVIFGASVGLLGRISYRSGAVEQSNFHDHRLLRMHQAPRAIHVNILDSDAHPGGVGEPGVPPIAPAIANAWFALSGERVRRLPILKG